jgi:hypothetical protein
MLFTYLWNLTLIKGYLLITRLTGLPVRYEHFPCGQIDDAGSNGHGVQILRIRRIYMAADRSWIFIVIRK